MCRVTSSPSGTGSESEKRARCSIQKRPSSSSPPPPPKALAASSPSTVVIATSMLFAGGKNDWGSAPGYFECPDRERQVEAVGIDCGVRYLEAGATYLYDRSADRLLCGARGAPCGGQ